MSYILDALRKAERDRRAQNTPTLDIPLPAQASETKQGYGILITLLIIVILGLLLYIFLPNQKDDNWNSTSPQVVPIKEDLAKSSETSPPLEPPTQKIQKPEPTIAESAKKQTLRPQPSEKRQTAFNGQKKADDGQRLAGTENKSKVLQTNKSTTTPSAQRAEEWDRMMGPLTKKLPKSQKTKPATKVKAPQKRRKYLGKIPWLEDLEPDFKRNLPNLNINVFVYDDDPKARFVIVNMRKYQAGQKIANTLILEEITPVSLILKSQGKKFRIPRP